MRTVRRPLFLLMAMPLAFALAACGGGGDGDAGTGQRVTDPAKVPTSTPIANAVLFTVLQDGSISASGLPQPATPQPGTPVNSSSVTSGGSRTHKVASGESCAAIANQYNVSVEELLRQNRFIDSNCSNLKVGDELKIPAAPTPVATPRPGTTQTPASGGGTYTVAAGDSCDGIATSNGITFAQLRQLNPSIDANCTNIKPGQVLKIR